MNKINISNFSVQSNSKQLSANKASIRLELKTSTSLSKQPNHKQNKSVSNIDLHNKSNINSSHEKSKSLTKFISL
jgi:hypothetical protein